MLTGSRRPRPTVNTMPRWAQDPDEGGLGDDDADIEAEMRRLEEEDLMPEGIERQNRDLLNRQHRFREAADIAVAAWQPHDDVRAIALIGSVGSPLWKEVPRFQPYRRARIELWHECADLDLAIWLGALDRLDALRKALGRALRQAQQQDSGFGVSTEQVDTFVFEPTTNRYLGRLCRFNQCPKGKRECLVSGCGTPSFLRQVEGFRPYADMLAPERIILLFDRSTGLLRRAAGLSPSGEAGS